MILSISGFKVNCITDGRQYFYTGEDWWRVLIVHDSTASALNLHLCFFDWFYDTIYAHVKAQKHRRFKKKKKFCNSIFNNKFLVFGSQ